MGEDSRREESGEQRTGGKRKPGRRVAEGAELQKRCEL